MPAEKDPYEDLLTDEEREDLAKFDELVGPHEDEDPPKDEPKSEDEPKGEAKDEPKAEPADEPKAEEEPKVEDEPKDEEEERPARDTTFAPTLPSGDIDAISKQIDSLGTQKRELTRKWREGELDEGDYDVKIAEIETRTLQLVEDRAIARSEARANEAVGRQAFDRDMNSFLRTMSKYEGVDYTGNKMLGTAFRNALAEAGQASLDAKDNAGAEELFERAHKAVIEQLSALGVQVGRKRAAPTPTPAAAPAPTPAPAAPAPAPTKKAANPPLPPTLGGLPAADRSLPDDAAGFARFAALEGDDLERAIAKMSKAELDKLDRAA